MKEFCQSPNCVQLEVWRQCAQKQAPLSWLLKYSSQSNYLNDVATWARSQFAFFNGELLILFVIDIFYNINVKRTDFRIFSSLSLKNPESGKMATVPILPPLNNNELAADQSQKPLKA